MFTLYRTEHVFKYFLLFWVLCALDVNCIEPTRPSVCDKNKLWNGEYAGKGCWEQMFFKNLKQSGLKPEKS